MSEPRRLGEDARAAVERVRAIQATSAATAPASTPTDDDPAEDLSVLRLQRWNKQVVRLGMEDRAGFSISSFGPGVTSTVREFYDRCMEPLDSSRTLIVSGPTGTGKTSLALTVAGVLVKHLGSGVVLSHNQWLEELLPDGSDRKRGEVFDRPRRTPMLLLDDFGAERDRARTGGEAASAAARRATQDLIEARDHAGRVTIVTTNVPYAQVTEVWGDRTASRLSGGLCRVVRLSGEDRRHPKTWG